MSVVISDSLAKDLLWWLQNTPTPFVTYGEMIEEKGRNKTPMMELAKQSMIDDLRLFSEMPIVFLTVNEAKVIEKVLSDFNSRLTEEEYRAHVQKSNES